MEKFWSAEYKGVSAPDLYTGMLHYSRVYRVDAKTFIGIEDQAKYEGVVVVRIEKPDIFVDIPFGAVLFDRGNKQTEQTEQTFTVIRVEHLGIKGFGFKAGRFSLGGIEGIAGQLQNKVEMAVGAFPRVLDEYGDNLVERGFWILEPSNQAGESPVSIAVVPGKLASVGPRYFNGIYFTYKNFPPLPTE